MSATYSQGTSVSFASVNYTVTSVTYSLTDTAANDDIDVSHLGLTAGASVLTMARPLKGAAGDTGREVSIEYYGAAPIAQAATGTLTISGAISVSANATCSQSSVTAAVNDVVKGSATFRLA
jgi:hypothetical protein